MLTSSEVSTDDREGLSALAPSRQPWKCRLSYTPRCSCFGPPGAILAPDGKKVTWRWSGRWSSYVLG
jgi:hypothetical protein